MAQPIRKLHLNLLINRTVGKFLSSVPTGSWTTNRHLWRPSTFQNEKYLPNLSSTVWLLSGGPYIMKGMERRWSISACASTMESLQSFTGDERTVGIARAVCTLNSDCIGYCSTDTHAALTTRRPVTARWRLAFPAPVVPSTALICAVSHLAVQLLSLEK